MKRLAVAACLIAVLLWSNVFLFAFFAIWNFGGNSVEWTVSTFVVLFPAITVAGLAAICIGEVAS